VQDLASAYVSSGSKPEDMASVPMSPLAKSRHWRGPWTHHPKRQGSLERLSFRPVTLSDELGFADRGFPSGPPSL
jgi:hypothetical protein